MRRSKALRFVLFFVCVAGCLGDFRAGIEPFQEVGCFKDKKDHALEHYAGSDKNMDPKMCMQRCASYPYFGIYDKDNCYCGHNFAKYGRDERHDCGRKCAGDRDYRCGGRTESTIYVNHYYANSWGFARYSGCLDYKDSFPGAPPKVQRDNMTVQACHDYCKGYRYFALNNGNTCNCGNDLGKRYRDGTGKCDTRCFGNANQICGGRNLYSVFDNANPWPVCTVDKMAQKYSVRDCANACAVTLFCYVAGYSATSNTCIFMTTLCTPPDYIGEVDLVPLPIDYKYDPRISIFDLATPAQCAAPGLLAIPKADKFTLDQCEQYAMETSAANYFQYEKTTGVCSLYSRCDLEVSHNSNIIGGVGDAPTPSLSKQGSIVVYIFDEKQKPIPNLPVTLRDEAGTAVFDSKTDGQGAVTITTAPGNYVLVPQFPDGKGPAPPNNVANIAVKPGKSDPVTEVFNMATMVTVSVRLVGSDGVTMPNTAVAIYDQKGQLVTQVNTDDNGLLVIELAPGEYVFKPVLPADRQPANENSEFNVTVPNGDFEPMDINVPTANPTPAVEQETITVTLIDHIGEALANIPVKIYDQDGNLVATATSDGNGVLSIELFTGEYVLRPVYPPGREPSEGDGSLSITVGPGSETDFVIDNQVPTLDINIGGGNNGTLALTLLDLGGTPLAGLTVGIYAEDGMQLTTGTTTATGTMVITQPPGTYMVLPEYPEGCQPPKEKAAFMVDVNAGEQVEMVHTTSAPAGCDSGEDDDTTGLMDITVVDKDGTPMENMEVDIYGEGSQLLKTYMTDASGKFTLKIPAGSYVIRPRYPEYMNVPEGEGTHTVEVVPGVNPAYTFNATVSFVADIDLRSGSNSSMDAWPGRIKGSVYGDENKNARRDAGEGIEGIDIILLDETNLVLARAVTNADGTYEFNDLVPGVYTVQIEPSSKIPTLGPKPYKKKYNVQPNSTSHFDLRLLGTVVPTSGRLIVLSYVDANANQVQDPDEQPIVGAPVILTSTNGTEVARAVTDESGTSTMEDVPFGMYDIQLDLSGQPEIGVPYFNGRMEMKSSTMRLAFALQV